MSVTIMTHPARSAMASNLVGLLGGEAKVVMDPDPGGVPNPLRTSVEAWTAFEEGSTHHLVLQDDVVPSADLLSVARSAAAKFPRSAVAFYTNWDGPDGAAVRLGALAGAGWVSAIDEIYTPTLALMLPVDHAARFSEEARSVVSARREDDAVMLDYLQRHQVPVLLSIPNLIEHQGIESIAGNSAERWRSACSHGISDRPGSDVLNGLNAVPLYREGAAYVLVLEEESADHRVWQRRPWRHAEDALGVDAARVDSSWDEWSKSDPAARHVEGLIGLSAARELWAVAYLLGVASERWRPRGWTPLNHVRSAALNTLGVGGLIPVVKWHKLHEARPLMHHLAMAGADHGASAAADALT
ncbi:hypothetical protein [Streptomyces tanashiensis]|uniref:hypothetical protein n=1 Tax=Streptomyces tanashiensis TaxID=67367 RepID=UPI00167D94C9|nr:hypothetical protein [Streptomyces tanashiensis]